jgi:hypothetical protein
MTRAVPLLLLAGGELVLAAVALRIAVWVARGWRAWRALERGGGGGPGPRGPGGPEGGLRVMPGGRGADAPPDSRLAA